MMAFVQGRGRVRGTRIVFMGTPPFAEIVLAGLLADGWNVVGVVTKPDRRRGRGRQVSPSPVKELASERGLPILQPEKMGDPDFFKALEKLKPELILTAAYGKILPKRVLSLPDIGCYNVHGSVLPAYRGAAPVAWAILQGERETGITIFRMDEGTDTGEVLACRRLGILEDETTGALTRRLAELSVEMLPEALECIIQGKAVLTAQDHDKATFAPVLKKADGLIDWNLPAVQIRNRVRAFDPWPGAFTFLHEKKLSIWGAEAIPDTQVETPVPPAMQAGEEPHPLGAKGQAANREPLTQVSSGSREMAANGHAAHEGAISEAQTVSPEPGEIVFCSEQDIRVKTGRGVLSIRSLQLEGKRRVRAGDFLHGHSLKPGDRLG